MTPDDMKLRNCATCNAPVATAAELGRVAARPRGVKVFGGTHWGRPHCTRCHKAFDKIRPHPSAL